VQYIEELHSFDALFIETQKSLSHKRHSLSHYNY